MTRWILVAPVVLALLGAGTSTAQIMEDPTLPAARSGVDDTRWSNLLSENEGVNAILNCEFDRANAYFEEMRRADPQSPAAELGLGLSDWWHMVAGGSDVSAEDIEAHLEQVIKLAKKHTRNGGERAEALYYSGRANSLLSSLYLMYNDKLKAARAAQRTRSYLEKCLDEDPEFHDANLGLGLYHYYADALPKFFKLLGWVFGVRGDREQGLAELRDALANGGTTGAEAAYFLTNVLTNFEREPDDALSLIRWLIQTYPNNHIFFLEYQNVLESLGYYREAEANLRREMAPGARFHDRRTLHMMLGRNLYRQARYAEGAEVLEAQLPKVPSENRPAEPWFYYFAGRCRDLMGDRAAAERHYAAAESYKTGGNVGILAEDRRKNPEATIDRRLRVARGLTRQLGRGGEAARAWATLVSDVDAERVSTDVSRDVLVFREALSWEEDGAYATAEARYRAVGAHHELGGRAGLGIARSRWRTGDVDGAIALLDSLAADPDFGARGTARRLTNALGDGCRPDSIAAAGGLDVRYVDPEAWVVDVVCRDEDGGEICAPLRFEQGAWVGSLPVAGEQVRYYYRVDGFRREPDPLARWERGSDNAIWSVAAWSPPIDSEWPRLSAR